MLPGGPGVTGDLPRLRPGQRRAPAPLPLLRLSIACLANGSGTGAQEVGYTRSAPSWLQRNACRCMCPDRLLEGPPLPTHSCQSTTKAVLFSAPQLHRPHPPSTNRHTPCAIGWPVPHGQANSDSKRLLADVKRCAPGVGGNEPPSTGAGPPRLRQPGGQHQRGRGDGHQRQRHVSRAQGPAASPPLCWATVSILFLVLVS